MKESNFALKRLRVETLPDQWQVVQLNDLVVTGKPIVYGIVQAGPHIDGGMPYIKSTDVKDPLVVDKLQRTSLEIAGKYKRSEVRPGDIVFSLRGNIGESCIVPGSITLANLTQGTARITVNEANITKFVWYALSGLPVQRQIYAVNKGSTFKEISLEELRRLLILLAPLPEQQKITAILSTWDRAIQLTERLITAKQKLKRALMQPLLTGKVRFAEFADKPWEWVELGKLTLPVKRPVAWDDSQLYKLASIRRHSKGMFFRKPTYGHQIKVKKLFTVKQGDFLISNIQAAYGAMGLVPKDFHDSYVSDQYTVLVADDQEQFDIRFLGFVSESSWFRHQILLACNGFFAERLRLLFSATELLKRSLYVPPTIEEQSRIVDVLTSADFEIRAVQRNLKRLTEQKKGLMQQLLTGKVRVNVDAATVEDVGGRPRRL